VPLGTSRIEPSGSWIFMGLLTLLRIDGLAGRCHGLQRTTGADLEVIYRGG
jgi:hypothetical protein